MKSMDPEDITFQSRYILQTIASIDPGSTYKITHNLDNNIIGIACMTSYMRDILKTPNIVYLSMS